MVVYLNGDYVPHEDAKIPVDDRGFLFADGVYEVVRVYGGTPFLMQPHVERMMAGLRALRIDTVCIADLDTVATRLIEQNSVDGDGTIYVQVTRGVAPRKHAFPDSCTPTVYAAARPFRNHADDVFTNGVDAITYPDTRWSRCDIKSIALLPNVLANQAAHEQDAFEALFVRDGVLIEGSHSNLFGVIDGALVTYPRCNYILPGITRALVLDLARELHIPVREDAILLEQLPAVEELFLSGTTTEVMPIARVDGRPVGAGSRGPITHKLQRAYHDYVRRSR